MFFLMKWREKWREKCSEISSRAGGFPQTPFYHQGVALTYKSARHSKAIALAGGVPQTPFFIRARPVGDTPKPRRRALPCVLFEKNQKGLSFSSARRKELKEASTLTKPSPIWEGCN